MLLIGTIIPSAPYIEAAFNCKNFNVVSSNNLEWTIMVHMNGDNDLESAGINDFLEMASVGSTDEVNIVVQFDRIPGFSEDYDNWNTTKRYFISKGITPDNANATMDLGEKNMGDPQTLIDFMNWAINNYPANHYCVILWDHGTGWKGGENNRLLKGLSQDWTDNDKIMLDELASVLEIITNNGDKPIDLIGFDACRMQMIEVSYELSNFGVYMTGSEESEHIDGWAYDVFLSKLVAEPNMPPENLGEEIVDSYEGYTMSTISLGLVTDLSKEVSNLGDVLQDEENRDIIYSLARTTKNYNDPDYRDLFDFTERLIDYQDMIVNPDDIIQKARNVQMKINETVKSTKNKVSKSHGISIYLPIDSYLQQYDDLTFSLDTQWDEFLKWLCIGQINNPPEKPLINGLTSIKIGEEYEYTFTATDPNEDDIYYLINWGDGTGTGLEGPLSSGKELVLTHIWNITGSCCISAICQDSHSQFSDWSILLISISKNKAIDHHMLISLFKKFIYRFPFFEKILKQRL